MDANHRGKSGQKENFGHCLYVVGSLMGETGSQVNNYKTPCLDTANLKHEQVI